MKTKIYIVACVNEDAELVSIQPYRTRELAYAAMASEYWAERLEFLDNETLCSERDFLEADTAAVGSDEHYYYWNLAEREMEL